MTPAAKPPQKGDPEKDVLSWSEGTAVTSRTRWPKQEKPTGARPLRKGPQGPHFVAAGATKFEKRLCTNVGTVETHVTRCAAGRLWCVTAGRKEGRKEKSARGVVHSCDSRVLPCVAHFFAAGEDCESRSAADVAARPFPKGVTHSDPEHRPTSDH